MKHQHHTGSPGTSQAAARRRRRWAVGLAGVTGLALSTAGLTPANATASVDANASSDANAIEQPHTTTSDRFQKPDQPPAGNRQGDRKDSKGKEAEKPNGTPVPCDADALIAAITLANARGGAVLDLAKDCTYLLTTDINGAGLPAITTPITLNGNKHTTIERAAAADQFRILTVNTGGNLTLNKLTITGGNTPDDGGAILVNAGGELTTHHSTITRNITENDGGGIAGDGTIHVKKSTISHNTAGNIGAGINSTGLLDISKSHVKANTASAGAGIVGLGTVRIAHSSITANHAQGGNVGGIFVATAGIITDSHISHNTALEGGGLLSGLGAQLTLRSVTLDGNTASAGRGGGLAVNPSSSVVTEGGVITNNTAATEGGGVYSLGEFVSRDTAITNNQADIGSGIFNVDTANLINTKVVKNSAITDGGGIFNDGGTVELNTATGTVVIKNRPNNCVDVPGCAG